MVERLLADPRVDPSDRNNEAIHDACAEGRLAVVERLLADPRVDPSDVSNAALHQACANGHLAVVERLLAESRVLALAVGNDGALNKAIQRGNQAIAELLKAHGCFDPDVVPGVPGAP